MMKKQYEKPTMLVKELKRRPQLLAGSNVNATMEDEWIEENW